MGSVTRFPQLYINAEIPRNGTHSLARSLIHTLRLFHLNEPIPWLPLPVAPWHYLHPHHLTKRHVEVWGKLARSRPTFQPVCNQTQAEHVPAGTASDDPGKNLVPVDGPAVGADPVEPGTPPAGPERLAGRGFVGDPCKCLHDDQLGHK